MAHTSDAKVHTPPWRVLVVDDEESMVDKPFSFTEFTEMIRSLLGSGARN